MAAAAESPSCSVALPPRSFFAAIAVLLALTLAFGAWFGSVRYGQDKDEKLDTLAAISHLKAREVEYWLADRMAFLAQPPSGGVAATLERWLRNGAPAGADREYLMAQLAFIRGQSREIVGVHLFDPGGTARLAVGDTARASLSAHDGELDRALRTGQPVLMDFHAEQRGDGGSQPLLEILTPLAAGPPGQERIVGFLLHQFDPAENLYPMIGHWPNASASAEAVLFRTQGEGVTVLSPTRLATLPPLTARKTLGDPAALRAQAIYQDEGPIEGLDYRGIACLGVVSRVPGTGWYLVAKMDRDEALAEARRDVARMAASLAALLLAALVGLWLFWRKSEAERGRLALAAELVHREMAESRRQNEEMFRTYFNRAMVGMATTSPAKGWIEVNPALCRILGYSREELLASTWTQLTHPDDLLADVSQFERVMAGEMEGYTLEKRFIRKDGRVIDAYIAAEAVRRPDGTVDYFVAIIEDITARRRAEKAIVDSERRLGLALEAAAEAMWELDTATGRILATPAYYRMLGYQPDEFPLSFDWWAGQLHPDDQAETVAAARRAIAEGWERVELECRMRTKDGNWRWIRVYGKTIERDDNGAARRAIGVSLDTTEQRLADQRQRREAERMRGLLDLAVAGETLAERDLMQYGLDLAERLTGSEIAFLHAVSDDQQEMELVAWSSRTAQSSVIHLDGHRPIREAGLWVEGFRRREPAIVNDYGTAAGRQGLPEGHLPIRRFVSVPVLECGVVHLILGVGNKHGDYGAADAETVQIIGNDLWRIVRRRRAEAALRENLEQQVALNRKLEEAHNQLLQSEKMAAIGQLSAGIAHELNNPIGFVLSNMSSLEGYARDLVEIIDAAGDPERVRALMAEKDFQFLRQDLVQLIGESRDGLGRVRRIVQDLKEFSHVGEAEWQWADLHRGLDSTLNIVWNELKYHCKVAKEYGELPEIWCLPSQLNQVFMNLLVNAGQAIEGQGQITIRTGRTDGEVWVEIADTGKGIAKEHMKRLFEPFFTTKPVGKGTGLGLSLSYTIVQRHGGRIEVDSEVGAGTRFRVILPIKPPDGDNAKPT